MFIQNADTKIYTDKLTKFSHVMDIKEKQYFQKKDKMFKKNFNVLGGLNDIYEWYTGAVYFKDYEWNELRDSELKKALSKEENNIYKYILFLDDGVILRGADIYYYFLTYIPRLEPTYKEDIIKWYMNVKSFLNNILVSLKKFEIKNNYDIRLLLGVIDNIRNIILLLYNCELLLDNEGTNFLISDNYSNKTFTKYNMMIEEYQDYINKCCFVRPLDNSIVRDVYSLINDGMIVFDNTIKKIIDSNSEYIFNKGFNRLRENDNYFENYYACEYAFNSLNKSKDINVFGLMYGGLELPFIIKNNKLSKGNVTIALLNQEEGNYFIKQQNSIKPVNGKLYIKGNISKDKITYIVDDNLLENNNFSKIKGIIGVRRPSLYRISQLKHYNNYLNIDLYNKEIFGLLTRSNYTRIKDNTNYGDRFSNELNICSVQSEIFLKALYCNNSFIKDSETDIFVGFNKGVKE